MKRNFVVAITGASGVTYSVRLLETLLAAGCDVHLSISPAGQVVLKEELGLAVDLQRFSPAMLRLDDGENLRRLCAAGSASAGPGSALAEPVAHPVPNQPNNTTERQSVQRGSLRYHPYSDFLAPIASGSFPTDGMVVCPCTGGTLSAIANGASATLIHRAAEVHLKERRKLILVPRETPLSLVHLRNMVAAAEAGAVILPAMPAFYPGAKLVANLVDFVVSRICDQLGVANSLIERWGRERE